MKRKIEGTKITFTFDGLDAIEFVADKASAATQEYAMMHGFSARIGDAAALSRKQKDGSVINVTEAMRRAEVERLVKHYESGTDSWEIAAAPSLNPHIVALAEKRNCTYAEAQAWFNEKLMAELSGE